VTGSGLRQMREPSKLGYRDVLISFARPRPIDDVFDATRNYDGILVDSGAYSVLHSGLRIDIEAYGRFCKSIDGLVDCYANLDVIGDAVGTARNQKRLEKMGVKPMPTFHAGGDLSHLKSMLDDYDHIALSGSASAKGELKTVLLDAAWRVVREHKNWPVKVHGWGITDSKSVLRWPWYSVDSRTWACPQHFGNSVETGVAVIKQTAKHQLPAHYAGDAPAQTRIKLMKTCQSFIGFIDMATRLWESRGVAWKD